MCVHASPDPLKLYCNVAGKWHYRVRFRLGELQLGFDFCRVFVNARDPIAGRAGVPGTVGLEPSRARAAESYQCVPLARAALPAQ